MITFYNDWPAMLHPSRYNWIDFTVAWLSFEMDRRLGEFEIHFALLGFHAILRFRVSDGDPQFKADIARTIGELDAGTLRISIPLAEYEALKATSVARDATLHVACQSGAVIREEGE